MPSAEMLSALALPASPQIASPALRTAPHNTVASKCGNVCVATGTRTVIGTTMFSFPCVAAAALTRQSFSVTGALVIFTTRITAI